VPGPRSGRWLAPLAAVLVVSAVAAGQSLDEHARWVADLDQARGHLQVSREAYRRGQHVRAGVHASHPIQELGYRLWRPVGPVDADLASRLPAALKEPGRAVQARVTDTLLTAIDEEYGEAVAEGRVVLEIEYQDAWAFFQRLRARWDLLRRQSAGPVVPVAAVDAQIALLERAFPGFDAPASPVPVERVKQALDAVAAALRTAGLLGPVRR
jgi:hypothetical protein